MNWRPSCLFTILLLAVLSVTAQGQAWTSVKARGQNWRELKPGKSRCDDVKRLLGADSCYVPVTYYDAPDVRFSIDFSGNQNNPVVKQVHIMFRRYIKLHDFEKDLSQYTVEDSKTDMPKVKDYINEAKGFN